MKILSTFTNFDLLYFGAELTQDLQRACIFAAGLNYSPFSISFVPVRLKQVVGNPIIAVNSFVTLKIFFFIVAQNLLESIFGIIAENEVC